MTLESPVLVSIVTVVMNSKNSIARAVSSVLHQTYKNIEYIVIDGGSTDGTLEILLKYKESFSYFFSGPDKGISDAFNKGISQCKGQIIGIINADDWYEPNAVEKVVETLTQVGADSCVIYGNTCYHAQQPLFIFIPPQKPQNICFEMVFSHPSCFVSKSAYERWGGFKENFPLAMDYELMLRFFLNGVQFYYVNSTLANMSFGGRSDKNEIKALFEMAEARKVNHCRTNTVLFWLIILSKIFKQKIRMVFGREHRLLQAYRGFLRNKKVIVHHHVPS